MKMSRLINEDWALRETKIVKRNPSVGPSTVIAWSSFPTGMRYLVSVFAALLSQDYNHGHPGHTTFVRDTRCEDSLAKHLK